MSKAVPLCPSHGRNADRTARGTALSQEWYTGSSYKKSYCLISSNEYSAVGLGGKITERLRSRPLHPILAPVGQLASLRVQSP